MNTAIAAKSNGVGAPALEALIALGDLSALSAEQRVSYYHRVCETAGLNPLMKPFDYIKLSGRLTLYANKGCAEQLRSIHCLSILVTSREVIGGVYVVTARARMPDGREDESTGAVPVEGLKGEALANAYMKAETKAKRRVTLSVCGLNMLDETEVQDVQREQAEIKTKEIHETVTAPQPVQIVDSKPEKNLGDYEVPFGRDKGKKISSFSRGALQGNVDYWRKREIDEGGLSDMIREYVEAMEGYLKS